MVADRLAEKGQLREDGSPVSYFWPGVVLGNLFFLLVVPEHSGGQYLKALARISRFFRDPAFRQRLDEVDTLEEVIRAIEEEDAKL